MLDVCLLGSGGMMPLPYRWLTSLMTRFNGSSAADRLRRGYADCGKRKGVELQADRYDLFHSLSWRSYQRASGSAAYDGKCGPKRATYPDWAKRTGTGGECAACDRAGTSLSDYF